jgi:hypothetical protein
MRIGDRNERIMFGVIVAGKTFLELIVAERQGSLSFAKLFAPDRGRHEAGDSLFQPPGAFSPAFVGRGFSDPRLFNRVRSRVAARC